ncbi:MAG: HNH endonuclease, partial [Hyphomicrobiales bacterium]|nr:HNH endonuclease [Hyphomicrobiales bacterium]MBV8664239.1 HNH endonuclease [Hyphomicrobiales bacterium]
MKARLDKRPAIARIREVLAYDPVSGVLTWRITSGRAIAGREAGSFDKTTGYIRVRIDGMFLLAHHVAWAIVEGFWPERVDHRHGKEAGNGWANLRLCTPSQNRANTAIPSHNTSGVKGVCFHKATSKWQAQIGVNGKTAHLGIFATKEEAAEAYAKAAREHFGEFARLDPLPPVKPIERAPIAPRRTKGRPTAEEVRAALHYDPATGLLRWGEAGKVAGQLTEKGYIRVGLFRRQYGAHVLIWVIMTGEWPKHFIDHDNNVRSDNRWSNLREATQSQNIANTRRGAKNTSGYKGVSLEKSSGRWAAY